MIGPTCQIVRLIVAGINVSQEVCQLPERNLGKEVFVANAVFKSLAVAFNAGALGAHLEGASLQTEDTLKIAECAARAIAMAPNAIINLFGVVENEKTASEAIENSITSFLSFMRAVSEESSLSFQHLATLPDDERKIPVFVDCGDFGPKFDHWENLTVQQCLDRASDFNTTASMFHGIEILGETKIYANTLIKTFQNVINQVHRHTHPILPGTPSEQSTRELPIPKPIDPLELNLVDLSFIPKALHQDPLLKKFICPISCEPIRHPVKDPTDKKTIYERASIVKWLVQMKNTTSPTTRLPLTVDQLIDMPVLKKTITDRLKNYQTEIKAAIERGEAHFPMPEQQLPDSKETID